MQVQEYLSSNAVGNIMNKYIKALSVVLVLSSSAFLSNANAASPTDMLITLAETDPVLVDRLNEIALTDENLLNQLLKMSESSPEKLEQLISLSERSPTMFWMIANIYNAQLKTAEQAEEEQMVSTFGAIDDGAGIIRN